MIEFSVPSPLNNLGIMIEVEIPPLSFLIISQFSQNFPLPHLDIPKIILILILQGWSKLL